MRLWRYNQGRASSIYGIQRTSFAAIVPCVAPSLKGCRSGAMSQNLLAREQSSGKEIAMTLHALHHHVGHEISGLDVASGNFVPTQRGRDKRLGSSGAYGIEGGCVAPDAVLRVVNCHMIAAMCWTMRHSNQRIAISAGKAAASSCATVMTQLRTSGYIYSGTCGA